MKFNKTIILLASLAILAVGIIGGTIAYLVTSTEPVVNKFTIGSFKTEIQETFNEKVKSDVYVVNKGDMDAYVRANVIITWTNDDGEVWNTKPTENEYAITWGNGKWSRSTTDGFWYYSDAVAGGGQTDILIKECKLKDGVTPPEGYWLTVDVLAQSIQATPDEAVQDAWGVTVNNGSISKQ